MTSLKFTGAAYLAATILVLGLVLAELTRAESQLPGQALVLEGDGDYVSVPSAAELQNASAITLEAWIRPDTASIGRIISKSDGIGGTSARSYDLFSECPTAAALEHPPELRWDGRGVPC